MDRFYGAAIVGAIWPFFWLIALAVPLWLLRKYWPRGEYWLYSPLSKVISRLATRLTQATRPRA